MIAMISALIDKGHAYHSEGGDVFFAVRTFPEYGKLSNKNIDDLNPGSRVEEDGSKTTARVVEHNGTAKFHSDEGPAVINKMLFI